MPTPDLDIIDVGSRPSFRYDMVMAAFEGENTSTTRCLSRSMPTGRATCSKRATRRQRRCRRCPVSLGARGHALKALVDDGFMGQPLGFNVHC